MNLIVCPKTWGGVEYHRLIIPFKNISDTNITPSLDDVSVKALQDNNISQIWFNRNISEKYDPLPIFQRAKSAGCKLVIDIDDYWEVPFHHILWNRWRHSNIKNLYADQIKMSDIVVTTHQYLADTIIKELGVPAKRIIIAPNAIDPNEPQYDKDFKYKHKEIFWQGSPTHHNDLKMISEALKEFDVRFNMAGYDERNKEDWDKTEALFRGGKYKRIYSKPTDKYMEGYNGVGICLIPLENNKFNKHKSNLKLLEAGWAKKPCIVSGIHPYTPLAKDGVNCLTAYNKRTWIEGLDILLNEPNYCDDLRFQLHEDIKENYLIDKINNIRLQLIKHLS